MEAETLFVAVFPFFRGELWDADGVDIHSVRVVCGGRGSWGAVRGWNILSGPGKICCLFPLGCELVSFVIPVSDCFCGGVHGVDLLHQFDGDPNREISN